jgi:hypothetical protein
MNIESVLKAKELLDARRKAKEANWLALQLECELQFEECRAVLNELKPQLKMNDLKIGGNGFSYRPHATLSQTTSYVVTIHNGEVAYCRRQSDACYLSKEKFFNEITETLAFYL